MLSCARTRKTATTTAATVRTTNARRTGDMPIERNCTLLPDAPPSVPAAGRRRYCHRLAGADRAGGPGVRRQRIDPHGGLALARHDHGETFARDRDQARRPGGWR